LRETVTQRNEEGAKMKLSDVNGNLRNSARQFAELYLDSSQKIGEAMLDLHEKSTMWARETPLNPLFEAQRSAGKQMLEGSIELARKAWGAIEKGEESMTRI
jgi:hypothetical protein